MHISNCQKVTYQSLILRFLFLITDSLLGELMSSLQMLKDEDRQTFHMEDFFHHFYEPHRMCWCVHLPELNLF